MRRGLLGPSILLLRPACEGCRIYGLIGPLPVFTVLRLENFLWLDKIGVISSIQMKLEPTMPCKERCVERGFVV